MLCNQWTLIIPAKVRGSQQLSDALLVILKYFSVFYSVCVFTPLWAHSLHLSLSLSVSSIPVGVLQKELDCLKGSFTQIPGKHRVNSPQSHKHAPPEEEVTKMKLDLGLVCAVRRVW